MWKLFGNIPNDTFPVKSTVRGDSVISIAYSGLSFQANVNETCLYMIQVTYRGKDIMLYQIDSNGNIVHNDIRDKYAAAKFQSNVEQVLYLFPELRIKK